MNCRYQDVGLEEPPSFKGDRILVMMFPYDLPFLPGSGPPERWDVVVFRYPEEPELSYIKRLVGLPGETIRIAHGDVYVKPPGERRLHPGPKAVAASVRHADQSSTTTAIGPGPCPTGPSGRDGERRPAGSRARPDARAAIRSGRPRTTTGPSCDITTSCPTPSSGTPSSMDRELPRPASPTLITDFYSYNTNSGRIPDLVTKPLPAGRRLWMQPHWVGDLTLESSIEVTQVDPGRRGPVRADQGGDPPPLHDRPGDRERPPSPGARRSSANARPR